ncbi:hypothetical protein ACQ4PT_027295 [Festuca glaucescens]
MAALVATSMGVVREVLGDSVVDEPIVDYIANVCAKLCEKLGSHGIVKPKQAVRSLAAPLHMNAGMEEEKALKKTEYIFDAPPLSSRDKAKIERNKRKEDRQREAQYEMHVAEMEALRAGMPPVYVNHSNVGLIGRNGTGKTSLLRAMAQHAIDGIPRNCQILHVEQEVTATFMQKDLEDETESNQSVDKIKDGLDKDAIGKRLEEIYKRLEYIDADAAEARATSILANHLDLHAVLWLETYLLKWPKTFIVVSHAREFLNTVVTDILHLHGKKLHAYKGDYDTFERTREEHLKNQMKAFETNEKARGHMQVRMAVFSQHHVDGLDLTVNPLLYMMRCFPGVPEQKLRSHLGSFGVSGNLALQSMYTLSGGQKSRVAFAKITFKKPHILLLDEPSNHLDLDAVEALIQGLLIFQGVLMASHDEHLITGSVDELWAVTDGKGVAGLPEKGVTMHVTSFPWLRSGWTRNVTSNGPMPCRASSMTPSTTELVKPLVRAATAVDRCTHTSLYHPEHTLAPVAVNTMGRPWYDTATPVLRSRHVRPHIGFRHSTLKETLNSKVVESMRDMERMQA